jgi:protein-tyrosine phosphatase
MVDLHCHLLPGVDDGPATMEAALDLARAQVAAGVRYVAVTPHVDWDYGNRAPQMEAGLAALRTAIADAGIPLEVGPGGEVAVTVAAELSDDDLAALRLGGGPWVLLEAPLSPSAVGFERIVQHVQMRGHRVLLAHPERSPAVQRDPDVLDMLVRGGALVQLTAGSFDGQFGRTVQRFTHELVGRRLVHVVSSDAHDAERRPPGLREPLERAGLGDLAPWLTDTVPSAIVAGDPIPRPPAPFPEPKRRRRFGRG